MRGEIPKPEDLAEQVFSVSDAASFKTAALAVYCFQYHNNPVYAQYCQLLKATPENVSQIEQVPFLPISFFKTHSVVAGSFTPQVIFESSGTTGMIPSLHFVKDKTIYERSFQKGFETFYGSPQEYCILGLLPSYLERGASSLVYMVDRLINQSGHPQSGF
ncbi:MAG: acyl transferase, partial [Chitinophagaceae bacterium]